MAIARRLPRVRSTVLRLAIANIHRRGALTPSVVLSLGLGLSLLVTVIEIDGNLHRQFASALPEHAPSFFFLDIPSTDADRFDALVHERAPHGAIERVPMLRGRIVAANGVKAEDLKPGEGSAWVLRGDRGITYAATVPEGSRLVAGEWWAPDYAGPPLVSLENRTATDLNLKIGDTVTVNVLGRNVTARIANLRAVDWQSLGINFVMVFSPGTFAGAPHTDIATLTFANGGSTAEETALIKALADIFPTVSAVRVKEALDAVDRLVGNILVAALRGASAVTLALPLLWSWAEHSQPGSVFTFAGCCCNPEDVGERRTNSAVRRLRTRISFHWSCRGCVRRRRWYADRRARRHARYGISIRIGAGPAVRGDARRASCYCHIRYRRNFVTALGHKPAAVLRNL